MEWVKSNKTNVKNEGGRKLYEEIMQKATTMRPNAQKATKKQAQVKANYMTYMVWVGKDEVVLAKAHDTVEASLKVEKQGYKPTGIVEHVAWADKYVCISDIPSTVLATNGIQPRCHKCDCLIDINDIHTKHGRAYCKKCMPKTK